MMRTPAIDPGSTTHHLSFPQVHRTARRASLDSVNTLSSPPFDCGYKGGRTPLGYPGAILLKNNVAFPPIDALLRAR